MKNYIKTWLTSVFIRQAKAILKKHKPIVVAVLGSVGKTGTKLAIVDVLKQKYRVQYQNGNYNVPLTVPLVITGQTLPGLTNPIGWLKVWLKGQKFLTSAYPYDVVVLELSTDKPGDIADFKEFLYPDISVVTAISEEHMEFFDNLEQVAEEELTVTQFTKQLVYSKDSVSKDYVDLFIPKTLEVKSFGFEKGSTYTICADRNSHHEFSVTIKLPNDSQISNDVAVASRHSIQAVGGAVAVGDLLGLSSDQLSKGIQKIKPVSGRMRLLQGINNTVIIDDSYNSSPVAAEAAIKTLYELKANQKIAIMGNMNELGDISETAHMAIGDMCVPDKLDLLITIGDDANNFIAKAAEANGCRVIRTSDPIKAGKVAAQNASDGAIILVKGSQNKVFSEEAVKQLLANPADIDNLVRQSDFWMNTKNHQFGYKKQ